MYVLTVSVDPFVVSVWSGTGPALAYDIIFFKMSAPITHIIFDVDGLLLGKQCISTVNNLRGACTKTKYTFFTENINWQYRFLSKMNNIFFWCNRTKVWNYLYQAVEMIIFLGYIPTLTGLWHLVFWSTETF